MFNILQNLKEDQKLFFVVHGHTNCIHLVNGAISSNTVFKLQLCFGRFEVAKGDVSLPVSLPLGFSAVVQSFHQQVTQQTRPRTTTWIQLGGEKMQKQKNMHSQCSQSIKRDVNWLKGTRLSNFRECLWLGLFHLCGAPCHRATLLDVGIDTVIFKDQIVSGPGAVWTWFTVYKIN